MAVEEQGEQEREQEERGGGGGDGRCPTSPGLVIDCDLIRARLKILE
jgi:hypothetical protein